MGRVLKGLGLLSRGHVVEADREKMIGAGGANVKELVKKALDGVLFIDEAYTLSGSDPSHPDPMGKEAIDTLLKEMEDKRDRMVVIAAGYTNEMRRFLETNPGLQSRFTKTVEFRNYSSALLVKICKSGLQKDGLNLAPEAEDMLARYFDRLKRTGKENFGNAREARNQAEKIIALYSQERKSGREDFVPGVVDKAVIRKLTGEATNSEDELNAALAELNNLIGLDSVKKNIAELVDYARYVKQQRERGVEPKAQSLHMVFTGAPGTGKTTVARLMGRIYKAMGFLPTDKLVETGRSDLVGQYMGHTAVKTKDVIKSALGGILFIDEAYTLNQGERDEFGHEAIDTLLKEMEDNRDNLLVIAAGYTNDMRHFLESNPGLQSRFTTTVNFENYTPEQLMQVFTLNAKSESLTVAPEAEDSILKYFKRIANPRNESFGNAREARGLLEKILRVHAGNYKDPDFQPDVISLKDVQAFTGEKSAEELEKDLGKAIASLNNLIGLREVKATVQKFVSLAKYNLEQEKAGISVKGQSYHMVFSGAPGTGKTTVARMMGKIFKALGILKTDKVIEIDRSGLVGQHVGETAVKTKDVIKSAMDGILFIDEAYTLAGADPAHTDSFGLEAINTLLKEMEDNRERLVVIVAGYTNEMRRFIESNTGLQSRFQTTVHFENYTAEELIEVLKLNAKSEGKVFSGEALEAAFKYFKRIANPKNEKFGNAREARKLYELVTQEHALRMGQPGFDITRIELCDIQSFTGEQSAEESAKAYEKAIAELNALTGLASVKETVTSISQTAKFARMQLDNGVEIAPPALHMVFTGAPGTGKTTVARLMGKIFKAIGVLATDKVVEVSRGDLVGQYMGHTAIKTKDVIKSAMDGILFVDEAYTLNQGERDEFGHEAIDTLLKEMEDHRDRLVVIIAGYTRDIENFISSNSGLESRFTQYVEFENYTPDELMEIIMGMARKSKLTLDERANGDLYGYFMRIANPANPKFGNAREARKIFEKILAYHSMNIGKEGFDMSLLTESEIKQAIEYLQK